MKKYITRKNAKRLTISSIPLMLIGYIQAVISLSKVYDTGNECIQIYDVSCSPLEQARNFSHAAVITMYIGAVFCLIGIVGLIFIKKK